jgi:energy-coupling factor transport system ATP-binding protein
MSTRQPVIQVYDLHHTYLRNTPLEVTALKGATLEVLPGEIAGIIGRSGAGKSTLVQHLNGLIRCRQPGKVIVDGQDMADPSIDLKAIRQKIGLIFQRPEQQLFERLVGDDIAFGPKKLGMPPAQRRERVRWAMEMVGLDFEQFKDRFTFSLSGGEMRKAAIAGVLALQPRVLILDEATTGIDPRSRKEMLSRIVNLHDQHGVTLIVVSSNMDEVARLADRITVMDDGRTVMHGTARQVFGQPEQLSRYGLGVPQVSALARRLSQRGLAVSRTPLTVTEAAEELWRILNS